VKDVKNVWRSIFQEILPLRVYITADVSILSLSVTTLFSLKSFVVYTGAAVTAVVKHEQTTSRYTLTCMQTTLPLTMKITSKDMSAGRHTNGLFALLIFLLFVNNFSEV
jgi:hypothetical protein